MLDLGAADVTVMRIMIFNCEAKTFRRGNKTQHTRTLAWLHHGGEVGWGGRWGGSKADALK